MNAEQYRRAVEIFQSALSEPAEKQRSFVQQTCADDTTVRTRVLEMLDRDGHENGAFCDSKLGATVGLLDAALPQLLDADQLAVGDDAEHTPERIGPYRIRRKIAEGGMGAVFEAEQENPRRVVALKTLRSGLHSASMLRRFQREIKLLGQLQHRGIAQIHEAGTAGTDSDPVPYFTMEYIRGRPVTEYAAAHALGTRDRLSLIAEACDAVQYAHQRGVIHRDLKPGNILVEEPEDGGRHLKVLDFGVARAVDTDEQQSTAHTDIGQLIGTLPYMSPEQVAGASADLDTRTDVYSLGVLAYELLTGQVPLDVRSRSVPEAVRIIREEEPRRLSSFKRSLRGDVETIIAKALEKDRERRYSSASELAADIRRYLADEPIVARPATTFYQLRKFARRNRGLMIGAGVAAMSLVVAVVASSWWAIEADRARNAEAGQRRLADHSANLARAGEAAMRRLAYRTGIAATQALLDRDRTEARHHLDSVPSEHRNWEWHYLAAQLGNPMTSIEPPAVTAWREDGTPIAARVRGNEVAIVNLRTRETIRTIHTQQSVSRPSLSPNARYFFASAAQEPRGRIWETATGRLLSRFPIRESRFSRVIFMPDGSHIAIVHPKTGEIVLRETATGRIRWSLGNVPFQANRGAVFSHDGSHLELRTSKQRATIDVAKGEFLLPWTPHSSRQHIVLSRDGAKRAEWNLGNAPTGIQITDAAAGERLIELEGNTGGVTTVTFSRSGRYLASSGFDDTVRIWDLAAGRQIRSVTAGEAGWMEFDKEETQLLFSSDKGATLWRWRPNPPATVLDGHTSFVYLVAYSPDGAMIASAGWDQTVRLWDARTGESLTTLSIRGHHVHGLGFDDDGSKLIAASALDMRGAQNIVVWDVATGERTDESRITIDEASGDKIREVTSEDAAFFASFARGGSKTVHFSGGEITATSHSRQLHARAGRASGGTPVIVISDRATGREIRRFNGHQGEVRAVAFSPDDGLLASGADDSTVRVWNAQTGEQLAAMAGHSAKIYTVTFSPDGTRIASGGNDNTIRLWDTESFEQVAVLTGHTSYVHSLRFSPDGTQLVSASGDHSVRIWDTVSRGKRLEQNRAAERLREELAPTVDRLLDDYGQPSGVAEHLRSDPSLSEDQRRAALRVLLARTQARR